MTAPTLIPQKPEVPYKVTFEYRTNILTGGENGKEQRIALRAHPRWIIEWEYLLAPAFDIRNAEAALFTKLDAPVLLPLWHEPAFLTAAAGSADTTVFADFSLSDAQPGETVYFHARSLTTEITGSGIIASGNDTSLTLTAPLGVDLPVNSAVYPTIECLLENRPTLSRYPLNAGRLPIRARSINTRRLGGNGESLRIYRTLPLVNRRPLANGLVPDTYDSGMDVLDFGGVLQAITHRPFSAIERQRRFKIKNRNGLQYLKLLLETLRGAREPFYIATWRTDLRPVAQPTQGGSTIDYYATPDYIDIWFPSGAHRDLQFETDNGFVWRRVQSAVDNLDGTITITLNEALPDTPEQSTINRTSLLERVRLLGDEFTIEVHHRDLFMDVGMRTLYDEEDDIDEETEGGGEEGPGPVDSI